jgi:hypothetical protein
MINEETIFKAFDTLTRIAIFDPLSDMTIFFYVFEILGNIICSHNYEGSFAIAINYKEF